MGKKIALGIIILAVVLVCVFLFNTLSQNPVKTAGVVNNPEEGAALEIDIGEGTLANSPTANVIEITSSGFTPSELTISKGETVTWINRDTEEHWPASAMHPTHTVYPGSDIKKCGTSEEGNIFDACRGLAPGEIWSFTFNEVGSWDYHDHLVNGLFGKIIVTE